MAYADVILADSPIHFFRLGESSGTTMVDSALTEDGLWDDPPTFGQTSLTTDPDTAALFNGSSDYGFVSNNYITDTADFSVEFWMQTSVQKLARIVARQSHWNVSTSSDGFLFINVPGIFSSVNSEVNVCDGIAHHIVVTLAPNLTDISFYIDGALVYTGPLNSPMPDGAGAVLLIGRSENAQYYDGVLDEVAIYNYELTSTQVADHYVAGGGTVGPPAYEAEAYFDGSGSLAVTAASGRIVQLTGSGTLVVEAAVLRQMTLAILDPTIKQAPTALTIALADGVPETDVLMSIDGDYVATLRTDSNGYLSPTSISVDEDHGAAGSHILTAIQTGSTVATGTFTVGVAPTPVPTTMGPDADPVEIPGAVRPNGTRRWVLQDLMPGGLGSYVMPRNPENMSSPYHQRDYNVQVTTAGRAHVTERAGGGVQWTFSGFAHDEAFAQKLLDYGDLNRRFYVITHRNHAFKVIFTNVALTPRLRRSFDRVDVDGHDYEVTALILDQDWSTPQ